MAFTPASPASVAAFAAIAASVSAMFLAGVRVSTRHDSASWKATAITTGALAAWLALLSGLVASGLLETLPLSGLPFFFGAIIAVSVATGLSPLGARLASGLPLAALVGFQGFRLPLELVLHNWAAAGTIPETMTWTGSNWDIVSGTVALAAMPFANRSRAAAWAANIVGFLLLLNVMRVALLSAPVPFGWDVSPPLLLALHLPYALIGPVCVGGALTGHIVLTRALLRLPEMSRNA